MRDARPHCAKAGTVNSTFAPFTMSAAYFSRSETTTPTRRFRNLRRFSICSKTLPLHSSRYFSE